MLLIRWFRGNLGAQLKLANIESHQILIKLGIPRRLASGRIIQSFARPGRSLITASCTGSCTAFASRVNPCVWSQPPRRGLLSHANSITFFIRGRTLYIAKVLSMYLCPWHLTYRFLQWLRLQCVDKNSSIIMIHKILNDLRVGTSIHRIA